MKSAGKFTQKRLGPRVAVRLKQRQHAIPSAVFGRSERRLDLGRMMRVIVHHHVIGGTILHFETTRSPAKLRQRTDNLVPRDSQLCCQRDDAERIAHVLGAGNTQRDLAEQLTVTQNGES